jgi:hypothetical protein
MKLIAFASMNLSAAGIDANANPHRGGMNREFFD